MRPLLLLEMATARHSTDCRFCGHPEATPTHQDARTPTAHPYAKIGWQQPHQLGLTIGATLDCHAEHLAWFDRASLPDTIRTWCDTDTRLVSYRGTLWAYPILRSILRAHAAHWLHQPDTTARGNELIALLHRFENLAAQGYDLWEQLKHPIQGRANLGTPWSLATLCHANGCEVQPTPCRDTPHLWQQAHYAEVLNTLTVALAGLRQLTTRIQAGTPLQVPHGTPVTLARP